LILAACLTAPTAHADGIEVRVEAVSALTQTPLEDYRVQLHPLRDFRIESTEIRTDPLGVATMTAPRAEEYLLLVAPNQARSPHGVQCATVRVQPEQSVTVRFELGTETPKNRTCPWLEPPASVPSPPPSGKLLHLNF